MRATAAIAATAVMLAGCGGGGASSPASDADTAGLPGEMRSYVACLRRAGIDVEIPASVSRLAKKSDYHRATPGGSEGAFNLFFVDFEMDREMRSEQRLRMRVCSKLLGRR